MGLEIRRVPPGWEHPENDFGVYHPVFDLSFQDAADAWEAGYAAWEGSRDALNHPDVRYWQWRGNPPNPDYHRPEWTEEPAWFQCYETVTEGTPVSPPFATMDELKEYLAGEGIEI